MIISINPMSPAEFDRVVRPDTGAGLGCLRTERGNLPLDRLDVRAAITGLVSRTTVTAEFVNVHDVPLEATYVFPLPDRAAVTGMSMTADGRTVAAELHERGEAREAYDAAVAAGQRATIAEQERPDVFTMRVGNILPRERVSVCLQLAGPLPYEDGAATYRFPLVVAPRYIPGIALDGPQAGDGRAVDTDAVPDASRITPPVLLPGFPNLVRLSIGVDIDPGDLTLGEVRSGLHALVGEGNHLSLAAGERADRDFVLRLAYAGDESAVLCAPDANRGTDGPQEGTYRLTVLPPTPTGPARPRDVVLLLDRSGSMHGWTMVAARRAAARIVDTLNADDRFAVMTFDHEVGHPTGLVAGLVDASDRNRYRAVEHLARVEARGGTEMLAPLREGLQLLTDNVPVAGGSIHRERVLVLVTDGQVGNEDQILHDVSPLVGRTRIHTVGIDRAVNAGFLGRLAALGAGRCELVESEDRLDEAMEQIHRRIGTPLVTDLTITADGLDVVEETRSPGRLPGLFAGVPLVVTGRYRGAARGSVTVRGRTRDDREWTATVPVRAVGEPAMTAQWARAHLSDLQDRYAAGEHALHQRIVETSLRFSVLCRFTAYVAVDNRVVTDGKAPHRIIQPVQPASGWDMLAPPTPGGGYERAERPQAAGEARLVAYAGVDPAPGGIPRNRSAMMPSATPGPGRVPPPTPVGVSLAELRRLAAVEGRRLRDAGDLPEYERRDALADLATRLEALLNGVTGDVYDPLRTLIGKLREGRDVSALWAEARTVLDAFATGRHSASAESFGGREKGGHRPFWKR